MSSWWPAALTWRWVPTSSKQLEESENNMLSGISNTIYLIVILHHISLFNTTILYYISTHKLIITLIICTLLVPLLSVIPPSSPTSSLLLSLLTISSAAVRTPFERMTVPLRDGNHINTIKVSNRDIVVETKEEGSEEEQEE